MADVQNSHALIESDTSAHTSAGKRRLLSLALLLAAFVGFPVVIIIDKRVFAEPLPVPSKTEANTIEQDMRGVDFSKFSHASSRHASLACTSCHTRAQNNSPVPTNPQGTSALPGHKSCTDCHLAQFVTPNIPMCAICHTDLNSQRPPVKNFPNLRSFNVKFDHQQHMTGEARPDNGCAACHSPARRGVALSIPAGLNAHTQCYTCHTPGAQSGGRDIASCGVCHDQGRYSRTSTNARAYNVGFRHSDHGPRQRLNCADCHNIRGGLPQSRQVSSPRTAFHTTNVRAQSCMTCHNGRRAFGDEDFGDCRRCHKGSTFRIGT